MDLKVLLETEECKGLVGQQASRDLMVELDSKVCLDHLVTQELQDLQGQPLLMQKEEILVHLDRQVRAADFKVIGCTK